MFLRSTVSSIQCSFSRQDKLDIFDIMRLEAQWSDIQALERRINKCCEDLESTMVQYRISLQSPEIDKIAIWKKSWLTAVLANEDERRPTWSQDAELAYCSTTLGGIARDRQTFRDQELSLKKLRVHRN
jgi:hypothetical protein